MIGALVALSAIAASTAALLGSWIAAACRGEATLALDRARDATIAIALPVIAAAAIAATIAHLAQTRAVWLPRRKLAGAPAQEPHPARDAAIELARAAVIGAVALGWLWQLTPRLAGLAGLAPRAALAGAAAMIASVLAAYAIAAVALGALDALVRRADEVRALAMTHAEKREDDRLAAPDPRWRTQRRALARVPEVASAAIVIAGDGVAVAIAWHPIRRPIPARVASGRDLAATELLALARRHRVAIHREPRLAAELAAGDGDPVEATWPRLAEIIAARSP